MKRYVRMTAALIALIAVLAAAAPALGLEKVNTNWRGRAIKGYDPVAYFTEARAVKGSGNYEYRWEGSTWRFSSRKHLELFKADPDKYAPQYGGY